MLLIYSTPASNHTTRHTHPCPQAPIRAPIPVKDPQRDSSEERSKTALVGIVWYLGGSRSFFLPITLKKLGVNAAIKVFPEEEQLKTALTNSCCSYKTASNPSLLILFLQKLGGEFRFTSESGLADIILLTSSC